MTKERYITIISFICIFIFFAAFFVFAWQEPTSNPPGGNVYAPINTGPSDQFKSGRFGAYTSGIDPNYGFTVGSGGIKVTGDSYYEGNITATGQICDKNGCIGDITTYWTLSADNTKLYPNSTDWNVGIGTTDPGYKLDVSGTIRAKDVFGTGGKNLIIGDDTYLTDIDQANMLGIYGMQNKDRAGIRLGSDGSYIFGDNGNIGIGTTSPGQKLTVNGDIDMIRGQTSQIHSLGQISFDWTTGGTYDNPQYHGIQSKNESGSWSDNLRINSYNDIINTLDSNNNNGTSYFKVQHHSSTNGEDLFWVRSADGNGYFKGNVGIGTTNPKGKLQIQENGVLSATDGNLVLYHPSSGSYSSIVFPSRVNYGSDYGYIAYYDDNNNYDYWGGSSENSALVIGVQNDGRNSVSDVVVLKSPASVIVDAPELRAPNGDVYAKGFYYTSDISKKIDIQPLNDSLDKILNLQGVSFNWKNTGESSIGLIAQDVEKIFPEVVSGKEGEKTIDYGKLVAPLIEALKEQQKEIEELKAEIEELKLKIK